MESTIAKTTLYTLVLNEEEAQYLRDLTQNCMLCESSEESSEHAKIREDLFNALYTKGTL